uniref:Uncharacterized protein n=1 Tax=Picea sitchensis TaxID=3332 RepID=A9NM35_PICSI|nr:unknown [Picea sitchensis]
MASEITSSTTLTSLKPSGTNWRWRSVKSPMRRRW